MRRPRRAAAATLAVALSLLACSDDGAERGAAVDGDADDDDDDDEGEASEETSSRPSGRLQLSGFREDHRRAVTVALTAVEVDDGGHILVDVDAAYAGVSSGSVRIARYDNVLEDDRGNRYPFVPPEDNEDLRLEADERLTGTLAFEGPVDPEARRFTLAFNQRDEDERVSAEEDGLGNRNPRFLFTDVPLPGVGLEADAVGEPSVLERETVEVGVTQASDDVPAVEVTVTRVETDARTVLVDVEVVNGSGREVAILNDQPRLTDDTGASFGHISDRSDDVAERQLRLGPGEEASATIAFRGGLSAAARELELELNPLARGRGLEGRPGFLFTIPLPDAGSGADDGEADDDRGDEEDA